MYCVIIIFLLIFCVVDGKIKMEKMKKMEISKNLEIKVKPYILPIKRLRIGEVER